MTSRLLVGLNMRRNGIARRIARTLLAGTMLCALPFAASALFPLRAHAQDAAAQLFGPQRGDEDAQMLLEADEVYYDSENDTVEAVGHVQIAYDGRTLVAQRVTYSQSTGRVIARGDVEIVEANGSHIFAEEIDITDNFSDGFISSLNARTPDNTRVAAASAERRDGELTIFNQGVYTACEPCKDRPGKPPTWQIRANRVIMNARTKRFEYEDASFEFAGVPIAHVKRFSHPDPSIKRISGFLMPAFTYSETLGIGIKNTFFWAIAPNYDITIGGDYYSNQGFLTDVEWRHRIRNGEYSLRVAGIDQQNPDDFKANTIDFAEDTRLAVMTAGKFDLSEDWVFGWNALFQSDGNFGRTYDLEGYNKREITNEVYLTGLAGKNYFDLRAQEFIVQDNRFDSDPRRPGRQELQDEQARVLPLMDYSRVSDAPVMGGQVSLAMNVQNIHRDIGQIMNFNDADGRIGTPGRTANERYHGIAGTWGRASMEAEWKRTEIVGGAAVTASLSGRGDGVWQDTQSLNTEYNPLTSNESIWRGMPAAMLEIRYPMVAHDGYAGHLFEPIAQIIARPDETHIGQFPNDDAQSFVFDTTNLFERDKFSGYDRVEGGIRANYGFRYSASFLNGSNINIVAGQSYHIAGLNSFTQRDLVNAGLESGLETDRSDYVASASIDNGHGFTLGVGGRFDEKNVALRRGEVYSRFTSTALTLGGSYVYIAPQPQYGFASDRHEVSASASVQIAEYWKAFGSFSFDLEKSNMYTRTIGLAYDDSCFSLAVALRQSEDRYTGDAEDTAVLLRLSLRTIGQYRYEYAFDDNRQ
jgi:LPS-assembly protein